MTTTQTTQPTAHVIQYREDPNLQGEMTADQLREMARLLDLQAAGTKVRLIHADPEGPGDLVGYVTAVYFSDGVAANVTGVDGVSFSCGALYGSRIEVEPVTFTRVDPTLESHPFKVGAMVYRTVEEALDKARFASTMHPSQDISVARRSTCEVLATFRDGDQVR